MERVHLQCSHCGHWEIGLRTKEQVAQWFRVHVAATFGLGTDGPDRESTCPRPCEGVDLMAALEDSLAQAKAARLNREDA